MTCRQVITAERSKADAQQAQVEADSIRIEKEAKARSARSGGRDSPWKIWRMGITNESGMTNISCYTMLYRILTMAHIKE